MTKAKMAGTKQGSSGLPAPASSSAKSPNKKVGGRDAALVSPTPKPKQLVAATTGKSSDKQPAAKKTKAPAKATAGGGGVKKTAGAKKSGGTKAKAGSVKEVICAALAELAALTITEPTRSYAAMYAGYEGESPGFKKALSNLKREDYIEYPSSSTVRLTAKGKRETPPVQPPQSNAEMLARLLKVVDKSGKSDSKANLICSCLADGRSHSLEEVAKASGYPSSKSSGFPKALGKLSGVLVERVKGSKAIRLADIAFPLGRPGAGAGGGSDVFSGGADEGNSSGDGSDTDSE